MGEQADGSPDELYPNMDVMPEFTLEAVLKNLKYLRRKQCVATPGEEKLSSVYSIIGPVLLALNPGRNLDRSIAEPKIYTKEWSTAFKKDADITTAWTRFGPHVYGMMEEGYRRLMVSNAENIVICGDAGSGKTYNARRMVDYLITNPDETPKPGGMSDMLARANEFLEAFGNAATVYNDNSSRFCKFSKILFDQVEDHKLDVRGLKVEHYLLELSRVIAIPFGEKNYHILHYLAEEYGEINKKDGQAHFNLTSGFTLHRVGDDERWRESMKKNYAQLHADMRDGGFPQAKIDRLMDIFRAILHLGNVEFEKKGDDVSQVTTKTKESLQEFAQLLKGVDSVKLEEALTTKATYDAKGQLLGECGVDVAKAELQRDALAKTIYSRTFQWIINIINENLQIQGAMKQRKELGLLDIFAFEDRPINGFEQMFINITNEVIQKLFNTVMFEKEKETYEDEGIDFTRLNIDPRSTSAECCDLFIFSPKNSLVKKIKDKLQYPLVSCPPARFVNAFNELKDLYPNVYHPCENRTFRSKIVEKAKRWPHQQKYIMDLSSEHCFEVTHYAGNVIYTVSDFLSKSNDNVAKWIAEVFSDGEADIKYFFAEKPNESTKTKSVGETIGEQLKQLEQTELGGDDKSKGLVFVRCIKPNRENVVGLFDEKLVQEQLKNSGVIDALKIRKEGFADRINYDKFMKDYWILEKGSKQEIDLEDVENSSRKSCEDIINTIFPILGIGPEKREFGKSRLFLKSGVMDSLRGYLRSKTAEEVAS